MPGTMLNSLAVIVFNIPQVGILIIMLIWHMKKLRLKEVK